MNRPLRGRTNYKTRTRTKNQYFLQIHLCNVKMGLKSMRQTHFEVDHEVCYGHDDGGDDDAGGEEEALWGVAVLLNDGARS